jgi:hypothetical protein
MIEQFVIRILWCIDTLRWPLEGTGNVNEIFRETLNLQDLEIAIRAAGTSIRLRKMNYGTLWSVRPHPKRKTRPFTSE